LVTFCVVPAGALFCFISTRHLPFGSLTLPPQQVKTGLAGAPVLASDRGRAIIGRACSALDCAGGRTIRGFRLHSREAQRSNHLPQRTQRPQRKKSDFAECSLSRNELQRDSGREHGLKLPESAWVRKQPRDLSTPPQSPAGRDPSESVERTGG